jgi:hypothetical protein
MISYCFSVPGSPITNRTVGFSPYHDIYLLVSQTTLQFHTEAYPSQNCLFCRPLSRDIEIDVTASLCVVQPRAEQIWDYTEVVQPGFSDDFSLM